jgi:hypothetical protein
LEGLRFATDSEVQQADVLLLQTPDTKFFYAGTQSLLSQWDKFLNVNADYLGVWCVPSATRVPCKRRNQIEVLGITLFLKLL